MNLLKQNDLCLDVYNNIVLVLEDETESDYDDFLNGSTAEEFSFHEIINVLLHDKVITVFVYDLAKI